MISKSVLKSKKSYNFTKFACTSIHYKIISGYEKTYNTTNLAIMRSGLCLCSRSHQRQGH